MNTSSRQWSVMVFGSIWKQCFAEYKRLGTNVPKAFAHEIIENNYFTWLYDYKNKNPGCTLLTEYNLAEQENEHQRAQNCKMASFFTFQNVAKHETCM
jgi:hypothetical protein